MPARRQFLTTGLGAGLGALGWAMCAPLRAASASLDPVGALRALEARKGGRLGAYVLDSASGRGFGWRANERFTQCSSFKLSLAAMMLKGAETGAIDLARVHRWREADLLGHSPVTKEHVATGLSVRELARAALVTSDNTAANVLLKAYGGPGALTRFWRSLDDATSRLDRYEPELNRTPPGTQLDTTSPRAMAQTLRRLIVGEALTPSSRATLKAWMGAVATGTDRLRAGFPPNWRSGDKTGTGHTTAIDIAFGGPADRAPLLVTAYYEPAREGAALTPAASAVLAEVGRIAAQALHARAL